MAQSGVEMDILCFTAHRDLGLCVGPDSYKTVLRNLLIIALILNMCTV